MKYLHISALSRFRDRTRDFPPGQLLAGLGQYTCSVPLNWSGWSEILKYLVEKKTPSKVVA